MEIKERLILDAITLYNRLNTFEQSAEKVSEQYGIKLNPKNIANWLNDFEKYIPFKRMREFIGSKYDKKVKITPKSNSATRFANFIMQAVANNKLRHEILQEFMLINDSVTVAVEVKEKPIEQLTIYALALSRLTTLRLFHFKCAWFDEEDYFEFYPLHVVYKKKTKKRKLKITKADIGLSGN